MTYIGNPNEFKDRSQRNLERNSKGKDGLPTRYKNHAGQIIVISEMSNPYLLNAYNYYERKVKEAEKTLHAVQSALVSGEVAENLQEQHSESAGKHLDTLSSLLSALFLEKKGEIYEW